MDTRDLPPVAPKRPKSPPRLYADEASQPARPAPLAPATPPPGRPPRKRHWGRRLLLLVIAFVGLGIIWGGMSAWLMSNGIERIPASELSSLDTAGSGPVNYLLVGSDSRENLPPELGEFFGAFEGQRTDVIMLAHVADGRLQLLSLPRDLKVEIPGHGVNRINAAFAFGGPDLLVQTVKAHFNMPVHHYLEVGFGDFSRVVDTLGGVDIDFPYTARDNKSGLNVEAGTTHLEGPATVAFVRSRTYEELRDGAWVGLNQSDIGRMARQQLVLNKLVAQSSSPINLFKAPWLAAGVGDSLTADEGLSMLDLAKLGWTVFRSGGIDAVTLPVTGSYEGGVAYVVAVEPAATEVLAKFSAGEQMSPEPVDS